MAATDRAFPRFAVAAAITARLDNQRWEGTTTNMSRGGLCGRFTSAVPAGLVCTFDLVLIFDGDDRSETLSLPARVVWCTPVDREHQAGVAFLSLTADQRSYLDLFIKFIEDRRDREAEPLAPADMFGDRLV
jgi:hypothetical protein